MGGYTGRAVEGCKFLKSLENLEETRDRREHFYKILEDSGNFGQLLVNLRGKFDEVLTKFEKKFYEILRTIKLRAGFTKQSSNISVIGVTPNHRHIYKT